MFPIRHGGTSEAPYNASGFLFNQQIGYLSDLTDMADSSWAVLEKARNLQLRDSGRGLPLLVVDCFKMQSSPWHSGIGVNFERAARLRCQRTIFTQVGKCSEGQKSVVEADQFAQVTVFRMLS